MKSDQTTRESQRVSDLANEYQKKGYTVLQPQSTSDLPAFLRATNYMPDLIAKSKEENLIIEVKSSKTVQELDRLSGVSELINAQKDWQFVLVLTNPRETPLVRSTFSAAKVSDLLNKSRALREREDSVHVEAAFLFAWAAVEASLRLFPEKEIGRRQPSTPSTLIRNAAMAGRLERKEAQELERLFRIRNSLLHAGDDRPPTSADVDLLYRVATASIREAGATA
jgi:hypothetical protein